MAGSVWEALSAIGTVAAVVVALGISGQSAWANRRADKDRAQLAAARMLSPLSGLERKASFISLCFAFEPIEPDPNVLKALVELEALSKTISIEDLYPLLKLPRHAAKRSARALGQIQLFVSAAHALLTHQTWIDLENHQRAVYYNSWFEMLSEIKDHLTVAVSVCESAASAGAPRPSPEEKHCGPSAD